MEELTNKTFSDVRENGIAIIYCWYEGCKPCIPIRRLLDELIPEYPEIKFYSVDVTKYPDIKSSLQIKFTPTLVAFKEGREVGKIMYQDQSHLIAAFNKLKSNPDEEINFDIPEVLKHNWGY